MSRIGMTVPPPSRCFPSRQAGPAHNWCDPERPCDGRAVGRPKGVRVMLRRGRGEGGGVCGKRLENKRHQ